MHMVKMRAGGYLPATDIELLWKAHMLCPVAYGKDTQTYFRRVIDLDSESYARDSIDGPRFIAGKSQGLIKKLCYSATYTITLSCLYVSVAVRLLCLCLLDSYFFNVVPSTVHFYTNNFITTILESYRHIL